MDAKLRTAFCILILGGVAAGCGGDDDSTAGAGEGGSLTKAEFVEQANSACRREKRKTLSRANAYSERHQSEGLPERVLGGRAIKAAVLGTIKAEVEAIRSLSGPAEDEQEIEAMLAVVESDLEEAEKLEPNPAPTAIEGEFADSDKRLRAYGLTECMK